MTPSSTLCRAAFLEKDINWLNKGMGYLTAAVHTWIEWSIYSGLTFCPQLNDLCKHSDCSAEVSRSMCKWALSFCPRATLTLIFLREPLYSSTSDSLPLSLVQVIHYYYPRSCKWFITSIARISDSLLLSALVQVIHYYYRSCKWFSTIFARISDSVLLSLV